MIKKTKQKHIKPDESFSQGPLSFARYGRHAIFESNWTKDGYAEMQRQAVEMYPKIVKEIDDLVAAIASLVSELPPEKLLHRAWWEFAGKIINIKTEVEIQTDNTLDLRMIDYIQSVIASVKPSENRREDVTEEEWHALREKVDKLFRTLNTDYQICRTAKAKIENPEYNDEVEEFYYKAQLYWCNVRGARYHAHDIAYLRDVFLPHAEVFQELFKITSEQFINELEKIWHSLTFGINDIAEEMKAFHRDAMAAAEAKLEEESAQGYADFPALVEAVIAEKGWQDRKEQVSDRFLGVALFDVEKVTLLPKTLIDELSWGSGEEPDFFAPGDFSGWPLRIWPVFKRPFIRLNGRCYCFDLHSLFDNIYRVMQRIILLLRPDYSQRWNDIQKQLSEELPFTHLERILPGATIYRSVYYEWYAKLGATKKGRCETDGLLLYDDHLFIIEARAGAFTHTSPANEFPIFIESLKNLVLKPATQGQRFLDYLKSAESVCLFDEGHQKIGELRHSDFRQITICPVTLDPFTEMAAQVQHLRKIGVDVGSHPVWALSIEDLRVYADIFENPLWFLHYIDQRVRAFQADIIQVDDEFDHLGLYFKHNNYTLYAEKLRANSGAKMNFTGYRSEIDKFFLERVQDPTTPCSLRQKTSERISEIINLLSQGTTPGRAALSSYLLDLDSETRQKISDQIDQELAVQPTTRRPKFYSSHGEVIFTVSCYVEPWTQRDAGLALDHTRTVLLLNNDEQRLLLELSYTEKGVLGGVHWQWVKFADIPPQELSGLQQDAEKLRAKRISHMKDLKGKLKRNDLCPCGSKKKYKKCCLITL